MVSKCKFHAWNLLEIFFTCYICGGERKKQISSSHSLFSIIFQPLKKKNFIKNGFNSSVVPAVFLFNPLIIKCLHLSWILIILNPLLCTFTRIRTTQNCVSGHNCIWPNCYPYFKFKILSLCLLIVNADRGWIFEKQKDCHSSDNKDKLFITVNINVSKW